MRNAGHKFDPSLRHRLCSRERLRRLPPLKILRRLGLKRGGVLVDIGCGTGFFALPAARLVGREGKVYGLDISPDMLADMMSAAARMRISNLVPVASSRDGRGIPPRASLYFLGNVFHEIEDKRTYLRRLSRRMGRDSRLAILDHHKKKTIHGPPQALRLSPYQTRRLLLQAGFQVEESFDVNDEEYAVVARIADKRKERT